MSINRYATRSGFSQRGDGNLVLYVDHVAEVERLTAQRDNYREDALTYYRSLEERDAEIVRLSAGLAAARAERDEARAALIEVEGSNTWMEARHIARTGLATLVTLPKPDSCTCHYEVDNDGVTHMWVFGPCPVHAPPEQEDDDA